MASFSLTNTLGMRGLLVALCFVAIAPSAANGQASDPVAALNAQIGRRVRIWKIDTGSAPVRLEGRVQYVRDTVLTIALGTDVHPIELAVRSVDRMAVPRAQSSSTLPLVTLGGMALGAWVAVASTPRGGPEVDRVSVGLLRNGTVGALLGGSIAFFLADKLIPSEHWVTVFKRRAD